MSDTNDNRPLRQDSLRQDILSAADLSVIDQEITKRFGMADASVATLTAEALREAVGNTTKVIIEAITAAEEQLATIRAEAEHGTKMIEQFVDHIALSTTDLINKLDTLQGTVRDHTRSIVAMKVQPQPHRNGGSHE